MKIAPGLGERLVDKGYDVFLSAAKGGDNFGDTISKALFRTGFMVTFMTLDPPYGERTATKYSTYVEFTYAYDKGIQLFPVAIDDVGNGYAKLIDRLASTKPDADKATRDAAETAASKVSVAFGENLIARPVPKDCPDEELDKLAQEIAEKAEKLGLQRRARGASAVDRAGSSQEKADIKQQPVKKVFADKEKVHTPSGSFTINEAAWEGNAEWVELLLKAGASKDQVDPEDDWCYFPLLCASEPGHVSCVELLLKAGANTDQLDPENGYFPLLQASQFGHGSCVELLLKAGANKEQVNPQKGHFPLLQAAQLGHTACTELLLKAGADKNQVAPKGGWFPLQQAAFFGHTACVKLLLEAGADKNQTFDTTGKTPLDYALDEGHAECAELLRKGGR